VETVPVSAPWRPLPGAAGDLAVYVANASGASSPEGGLLQKPTQPTQRTLIVCHGLPVEPHAAGRTGRTFPALADRLAHESGWQVVTCCLRGVGMAAGDYSLAGWIDDLRTVLRAIRGGSRLPVWLAGFGIGGSLALCLAAEDVDICGVATLGSPASFAWSEGDPQRALAAARRIGVVRSVGFPTDPVVWSSAGTPGPAAAAALMPPRPMLVVHGADDEVVSVADARTLAEAGRPASELRLLAGAGHRLRADPRAVALLLGWLERQGP